jgi:hypothetical protein
MRIRWRKAVSTATSTGASVLIGETEAFLSGEYASLLRSRGLRVPKWAWLNSFAHGNLRDLHELHRLLITRVPASGLDVHEEPWVNAQCHLGKAILGVVGDDPALLSLLQRAILVPLELELIRFEEERGLTEYELVQSVRTALRSCIR